jgi:hypothetical protein
MQMMDGKTVQKLKQAARILGLPHQTALNHKRAQLAPGSDGEADDQPYLRDVLGGKRYKEIKRLLRRLKERGNVTFGVARKPDEILDALEGFLTLEASGWKGRGGTALYSLKQIAAFSRQAVSSLAAGKACEIHTMRFDGKIIAALICFKRKGKYLTWKTAFDEEFSASSPGVQIVVRATEYWLGLKTFKSADSLAIANHSVMGRVWRERISIGMLLIGTGKTNAGEITTVVNALDRFAKIKVIAKTILNRISGGSRFSNHQLPSHQ